MRPEPEGVTGAESTRDGRVTTRPIADPEVFTEIMTRLATQSAPGLFAVVQELDDRADVRIAGWGMAFDRRAEVCSVDGTLRMGLNKPEEALPGFSWGDRVTPHIVWVTPRPDAT